MAREATRAQRETTSEQWARIREILANALELDPAGRTAYLETACSGDPLLRTRIDELIAAHDATGASGLELPAFSLTSSEPCTADALSSQIGRRIGSYRIEAEIAHGGMGTVFRAVRADDEYKKQVAIKLVGAGVVARAEVIQIVFAIPFFAGEFVVVGGDLRVPFLSVGQERALPNGPAPLIERTFTPTGSQAVPLFPFSLFPKDYQRRIAGFHRGSAMLNNPASNDIGITIESRNNGALHSSGPIQKCKEVPKSDRAAAQSSTIEHRPDETTNRREYLGRNACTS